MSERFFSPKMAIKAQERYCEEHELPCFAPSNGRCPRCGYNIYLPTNDMDGAANGYTVNDAGSRMITSCPHCCYSFVE